MGIDIGGSDERGATPVVGIVLLVAIVIVLAAVIGQYVFGLDLIQSPEAGPQVSFSEDYDEVDTLNLTHESGDELVVAETTVVVSGGDGDGGWNSANEAALQPEITSGDTIVVDEVEEDETVRVIWTSPETGDSYVVWKWEGPEAGS